MCDDYSESQDFVSKIPLSKLMYARSMMLHLLTKADARMTNYLVALLVVWVLPRSPPPLPAFLKPATAARAWPVEPVASLPRADPWPMRGDNKTARGLWRLDSAVARGYLIKVAEGLVAAFSTVILGKSYSCRYSAGRFRAQGPLGCPARPGLEDWVLYSHCHYHELLSRAGRTRSRIVHKLCDGATKIPALLRNIRSQVSPFPLLKTFSCLVKAVRPD